MQVINLSPAELGIRSWSRRETPLVHALVWTTTPWTLPLNNAVAFSSALAYSVVQFEENKKCV